MCVTLESLHPIRLVAGYELSVVLQRGNLPLEAAENRSSVRSVPQSSKAREPEISFASRPLAPAASSLEQAELRRAGMMDARRGAVRGPVIDRFGLCLRGLLMTIDPLDPEVVGDELLLSP